MIVLFFNLAFVFLVGGAAALYMGYATPTLLLDAAMTLGALAGLAGILRLPWDLYFEARGLAQDQAESVRRGLQVDAEEQAYSARMAPRLLLLCVALHLGAAGLAAGASYLSGGKLGYYFAAFFLVSTSFRPLGAFYVHVKRRLVELRQRAKVPRKDARDLAERLATLERRDQAHAVALEHLQGDLGDRVAALELALAQAREDARRRDRAYDDKVDRVCHEFQGSLEKLTEDRELLHGMRAFVRMVKES